MNLWIRIIFCIQILVSLPGAFAQDCNASLKIYSDIDNVNIFINDSLAGGSKNFATEIEPGNYVVKALENSAKWDSKAFIDTINVKDCSEISLTYFFRNEVLLDTDPRNAVVFREDSLIGFTPLLVNPQFDMLLLQKTDYLSREIFPSDLNPGNKIKLEFIGKEKSESFYGSTLFKILAGTALALGAATAYFKIEADNKFDEYKITGDPELLEQTDRLDIISAVTFVALQIDFGLIIYFFLSD